MNGITYCCHKVSHRSFTYQEVYNCGKRNCIGKLNFQQNDTSLQLDFILKSTSTFLVEQFPIIFNYTTAYDWFDLTVEQVYNHTKTCSTISGHDSILTSYFTEVARLCSNKHTLHTANFIEDGTPRWGELFLNPISSEFQNFTVEELDMKIKKLLVYLKRVSFGVPNETDLT